MIHVAENGVDCTTYRLFDLLGDGRPVNRLSRNPPSHLALDEPELVTVRIAWVPVRAFVARRIRSLAPRLEKSTSLVNRCAKPMTSM